MQFKLIDENLKKIIFVPSPPKMVCCLLSSVGRRNGEFLPNIPLPVPVPRGINLQRQRFEPALLASAKPRQFSHHRTRRMLVLILKTKETIFP